MLQTLPRRPSSVTLRHLPRCDRITLIELRFSFLPATFRHRDRLHRVTGIRWIRDLCRRDGAQRHYRVLCADGNERTLIHDLEANIWYMQRERLRA
ncbi:hypothetical protein [Chloroflexus sp.]|uniref:hypothetical protein n=1 Tax=Chloroflexus sp. TaxID=1904827 RepID=UPI00262D09CE|nr:hypothetical protein [uncultured Chloroflexus sp.]